MFKVSDERQKESFRQMVDYLQELLKMQNLHAKSNESQVNVIAEVIKGSQLKENVEALENAMKNHSV